MKAKIVPEKTNLHPRNLHKFGYDFEALTTCSSELKNHVLQTNMILKPSILVTLKQ